MNTKKKILGMNVLRVCAALGIMAYHYFFIGPIQGFYSMDVFCPLAYFGEWGVDIFFLISGFFILHSCRDRTCKDFVYARLKRIYPIFIIGSLFVLGLGIFMPNAEIINLLYRWFTSLLFVADLTDTGPLSNIYWTLFIEVRFYILAAIVLCIKQKSLHNRKIKLNTILAAWLLLAIFNTYWLNWHIIETLFITKYAGHFILGITLYQISIENRKDRSHMLLMLCSSVLVLHNIIGYTGWIQGLYSELLYTEIEILAVFIILIYINYS